MKALTLLLLAASLPLTACSKKEDALGASMAAPGTEPAAAAPAAA